MPQIQLAPDPRLSDSWWRLNHLYHILDKDGNDVAFKMRASQEQLWREMWYLNVILKARQLGFSTEIGILFLDECLFKKNTAAGIVDLTLPDAIQKLAKIRYAYQSLPDELKAGRGLVKESASELQFSNGSSIKVGVSHRGGTLQLLHVSELGKIAAEHPERAREIKTGSFNTVASGGMIFVESTAEGTGGEFYEITERAQKLIGKELTELDFKFHFFPWWQAEEYRMNATIVIPADTAEYFRDLEAKHGIKLEERQKIWYTKKLEQLGFNQTDMFKEYPSIPEEAFFASLEGAYFKRQMIKMRRDGRLGVVPFDPSKPVNTFWDIGRHDATSIWFHQTDGVRHRLIDYYEEAGESVDHYAAVLKAKSMPENIDGGRGFSYGKHYGPHDLDNQSWILPGGQRIKDVAKQHGINFVVVPRIQNKMDSIEAARAFLHMCWIDEAHCKRGIQVLDSYQKDWIERLATWAKTPLHNWASHGADALQTGAMGLNPREHGPKPSRSRSTRFNKPAWAA